MFEEIFAIIQDNLDTLLRSVENDIEDMQLTMKKPR